MNANQRFVQHIIETRYDDLSPAAIAAAKIFFLDTLGVAIAGNAAPFAAEIRQAVTGWGSDEQASIFGLEQRLPAGNAALVNGYHAHCQEFDCVHEAAVIHPLASIQSAILAWCERRGTCSGKELILALCLGVDVATSIGSAALTGLRFFRPAAAGIFGVTAAVGKLAELEHEQMLNALGLALMQSAGTMQAHVEGKPTLALAVGMAARNGLQVVDLAAAGMTGPHDFLEGPFAYFPLLEGEWDLAPVLAELGKIWRITQVSHKPFPCGRANHGGIDGIQQLKAQGLRASEINTLELIAPPLIHQLVGRPIHDNMEVNYARLCFQYVGAVALTGETVDVPDFSSERIADPDLHQLAQRISVLIDDNPDPNALVPQKVVAHLQDGSSREVEITHTLGSPDNPLSREQHLDKFRRCWAYGEKPLTRQHAEQLIIMVDELETLDDIASVLALLQP